MTTIQETPAEPITDEEIFRAHLGGKIGVSVNAPIAEPRTLSTVYTPGVAKVSLAIAEDPSLAAAYTWTNRLVAVVSDGSAVLGLGDIGAAASLPVMEGKAALFKTFGGLDSIPLVLDTNDVEEIVATLVRLRPSFGAVNLEDVAAPRCFELEARLIEALDCPVMHDDQHGTAVVTLAALRNAAAVSGREMSSLRVVISGAGAAGVACAKLLHSVGVGNIAVLDSRGIVRAGRAGLNPAKQEVAAFTNLDQRSGGLSEALTGADVFIGLSGVLVDPAVLRRMNPGAIVFALSNPTPEVHPDDVADFASVTATGRSDFPNQINNVLAFPGIFRGALDAGASRITQNMKLSAAHAIASVAAEDLSAERIVPSALDPRVGPEVAQAVRDAAIADGIASAGTA
ncbi:MAG: NAD(P)-dependent malic enzyme [Sciscionella sp.]